MPCDATEQESSDPLTALTSDVDLFHTPAGEAFASVLVRGHRETYPVDSRSLKEWLSASYYRVNRKALPDNKRDAILAILSANAKYDGACRDVYVRAAEHEGDIYIDLGDADWRVVKISKLKPFEVLTDSPVKFTRPKGMLALPVPEKGGSVNALRLFLNLKDDDQFRLIIGFLLAAFRPQGPYPILEVNGDQGSAKSTASKVLRALVDPNVAPARSLLNERDLMLAANNGWLLLFDNVSNISKSLSDAMCRVSTGGAYATRKLYTNDEETLINAQRPMVLNGIGEFVTESDLLDRTIVLELPTLGSERRRDEKDFWTEFEAAKPKILGALFDAVSASMSQLPFVADRPDWPRMADFAKWVTAAEAKLGWQPGAFMDSYQANRREAHARVLDDNPLAHTIMKLASEQWTGTATELLDRLRSEEVVNLPSTPQSLTKRLKEIGPNLRSQNVAIAARREGHESRKMLDIRKVTDRNDRPSAE